MEAVRDPTDSANLTVMSAWVGVDEIKSANYLKLEIKYVAGQHYMQDHFQGIAHTQVSFTTLLHCHPTGSARSMQYLATVDCRQGWTGKMTSAHITGSQALDAASCPCNLFLIGLVWVDLNPESGAWQLLYLLLHALCRV